MRWRCVDRGPRGCRQVGQLLIDAVRYERVGLAGAGERRRLPLMCKVRESKNFQFPLGRPRFFLLTYLCSGAAVAEAGLS